MGGFGEHGLRYRFAVLSSHQVVEQIEVLYSQEKGSDVAISSWIPAALMLEVNARYPQHGPQGAPKPPALLLLSIPSSPPPSLLLPPRWSWPPAHTHFPGIPEDNGLLHISGLGTWCLVTRRMKALRSDFSQAFQQHQGLGGGPPDLVTASEPLAPFPGLSSSGWWMTACILPSCVQPVAGGGKTPSKSQNCIVLRVYVPMKLSNNRWVPPALARWEDLDLLR